MNPINYLVRSENEVVNGGPVAFLKQSEKAVPPARKQHPRTPSIACCSRDRTSARVAPRPNLRRVKIDLHGKLAALQKRIIKDPSGDELSCEMPRINDAFHGKDYCIFYAGCVVCNNKGET